MIGEARRGFGRDVEADCEVGKWLDGHCDRVTDNDATGRDHDGLDPTKGYGVIGSWLGHCAACAESCVDAGYSQWGSAKLI